MKKTLLGLLLVTTVSVFAESPLKEFPKGLGLGAGAASGVGFSYRQLDEQWGWQVTGIAYRAPGDYGNYFASLGAGVQKPPCHRRLRHSPCHSLPHRLRCCPHGGRLDRGAGARSGSRLRL